MAYDCDIIIVGAGPVGLFLATELGMRGMSVKVFDDKAGTCTHPAANANSARTMEHFRRLGISKEVRSLGLPGDHATDVAYYTRLSQHELARLAQPSSDNAVSKVRDYEFLWPTPELPHRCSQLYIEPALLNATKNYPSVDVKYNCSVQDLVQDGNSVTATVATTTDGSTTTCTSRYLVGCDGPRSTVRNLTGLHYSGSSGAKREFMGGRMAATYFSAPTLYSAIKGGRAWQYWTLNHEQRSLVIAVDGKGNFIINIQLQGDIQPSDHDVGHRIATAIGADVPFHLISSTTWTAGFALVAEKMWQGRIFLAGDSAHLFTPTGGMGYNTGIEDAANLAWKLEAMVKGASGDGLAESYEAERKPVAARNTEFARQFADSIGYVRLPEALEDDSASGRAARQCVGSHLNFHAHKEFVIPGLQLGTRYEGSPLVCTEASAPPPDTANLYLPVGRPGHRAPHVWLSDGSSLYDHFGCGFTLLRLGSAARDPAPKLADVSASYPVTSVAIASDEARDLYEADYILVRPDQHIAWRGNQAGPELGRALDKSLGVVERH
ncbi:MAG: hypothetical protein EPN76_01075 [Burkholderiaceae bacterium]|nr:MAG: hypothetical protein EPN76_01075 [Burkholderiaceae bacterium]TAM01286.1 MAG: hypothetical protein EPN67_13075 [Pusillimonas sp.]